MIHFTFSYFELIGVHVLPVHFYSPVPDTRNLSDATFEKKSETVGLDWNFENQQKFIDTVFSQYSGEVPFEINEGLAVVDAAILHSFVRHFKPKKVIEIGAGQSTYFTARALEINRRASVHSQMHSIEPYLNEYIRKSSPQYEEQQHITSFWIQRL